MPSSGLDPLAAGVPMIRAERSHAPFSRLMMVGAAACLLVSGVSGGASTHAHVKAPTAFQSGINFRAGTGIEDDSGDDQPETGFIYLVLKLGDRRLYVMKTDGNSETQEHVESFPVAIGRKRYATPIGRFRVTDKMMDPDWVEFDDWDNPSRAIRTIGPGPDNPLGIRWIGFTSAYGWEIGFHGTPQPELIGQAVSHGCVRMRNSDVVKLYSRVKVGTLVIVQP
jgi:lipoprotein-anchoring transpeptidase ErfK/SrfK